MCNLPRTITLSINLILFVLVCSFTIHANDLGPHANQQLEINVTSPKPASRHNYFPTITGTAKFKNTPENSGGGAGEFRGIVEVRISIQANGKIWNGKDWFLPKTNDEVYPFQATLSGETWQYIGNLPSKNQSYSISVLVIDSLGIKYYSTTSFSLVPIELTIIDANKKFVDIDFSNDFRGNISDSQINYLLEKAGLEKSPVEGSVDPTSIKIDPANIDLGNAQKVAEYYQNKTLEYLKLRRMMAVADGVTKLLVIAKGVDPGSVTFERSANPELADKFYCNQKVPLLTTIRMGISGLAPVEQPYQTSLPPDYPQPMQMCTTGDVYRDRFSSFNSYNTAVNTTFYQKSDNTYYWFALYTVPPDINHEKNIAVTENSILGHLVSINATFKPESDEYNSWTKQREAVSTPLFLLRPPVLLVHGLNDQADSWDLENNTILQDAGFDVRTLDYRQTNGERFQSNRLALLSDNSIYQSKSGFKITSQGILEILESYRTAGIAISQVDVVGHSLGGLLARIFYQQPEYRSFNNFDQGYIHRLITIGTPHFGSHVANLMINDFVKWGNKGCATQGFQIAGAINWWNTDFWSTGGRRASFDLQIGSTALSEIEQTKIPSHAIVSTVATTTLRGIYSTRFKATKGCLWNAKGLPINYIMEGMQPLGDEADFVSKICDKKECDWTVQGISQEGGLSKQYVSFMNSINHGEEIGSVEIRQRVLDLLKSNETWYSQTGFPAVAESHLISSIPAIKDISKIKYEDKIATQNTAGSIKDRKLKNSGGLNTLNNTTINSVSELKNLTPAQRAQLEKQLPRFLQKLQNSANNSEPLDVSEILNSLPPNQQAEFEKQLNEAVSKMLISQNVTGVNNNKMAVSQDFRQFTGGNLFTLDVPKNWKEEISGSMTVVFTPENGKSGNDMIRGLAIEATPQKWESINVASQSLVEAVIRTKPYMKVLTTDNDIISNRSAFSVKLSGTSDKTGQTESIIFSGVLLESGNLLYIGMFCPETESAEYQAIFSRIKNSLKIN